MKILKSLDKIPGGIVVIPMAFTALLNTVFPAALKIGGATTAAFTSAGSQTLIGILLFITGARFMMKDVPAALKRGGVLFLTKIIITVITAFVMLRIFGLDGFLGVPTVAVIVGVAACNPGVYMAMAERYGDAADRPAFGLFNILVMPMVPLVIIGAVSGGGIDWMSIIATFAPFIFGMIVGNLDHDFSDFFATATRIILFFIGFTFGANVNLIEAFRSGLSGILLGVIYFAINLPILLSVDKFVLRRPGYAATAFSGIGGIAVGIPAIIAASLPEYLPYVETASSQLSLTVVLTSVMIPIFTKLVMRKYETAEAE